MPYDDPSAPIAPSSPACRHSSAPVAGERTRLYTIVRERQAQVYTLFGKVIGTLDEAGLRLPILNFGPQGHCWFPGSASVTWSTPLCASTTCATSW